MPPQTPPRRRIPYEINPQLPVNEQPDLVVRRFGHLWNAGAPVKAIVQHVGVSFEATHYLRQKLRLCGVEIAVRTPAFRPPADWAKALTTLPSE